ncbi:MAG: Druantia anti-phage system protein DruA [bacterium]
MIICGRDFSNSDLEIIKETISMNPCRSRRKLSFIIAERLNWRQPNGNFKDRVCRDVLLRLQKKGILHLPEPSYYLTTQTAGVKPIHFVEPCKAITGTPGDFDRPKFKVVEQADQKRLWNYLIDRYHYKGCRIIDGRHLKYLLYLNGNLIGCFAFADAVLQLTARDQWLLHKIKPD